MEFWKGEYINKLEENEVFVFGANPQARHFAGAAKVALGFGAIPIDRKKESLVLQEDYLQMVKLML